MPDVNTPQTIMAFDFGTQKMGMSVGQSLIASASPLPLFLVGLPLNMDDSESELSTRARKFARRLRHQTNIATLMVDERLTTREARDELDHYQAQGRGKKLSADSIAAALLIESWYRHPAGITP